MTQIDEGITECPNCGGKFDEEIPPHHLKPGSRLRSRYLIGNALGEGGFGITYIGRDLLFDDKIAVKEYYPSGSANRSNLAGAAVTCGTRADIIESFKRGKAKFLDEAKILAKFSKERGIVSVRDYFEENNTAYIVMEYLDGDTLGKYIKKNNRISPKETVEILMPVMEALKKVHSHGLLHRDISPDNIMLQKDGTVKLLDFGAARNLSSVGEDNKSLSVLLKPGYAPEEQYRRRGHQGPWTDIYALCATMYKCITGITPDDASERVYNDELVPPHQMDIEISPKLEKTILKGMNIYSKDRFQSVEELIADLVKTDGERNVAPPSDEMNAVSMKNEPASGIFQTESTEEDPHTVLMEEDDQMGREEEDPHTVLLEENSNPIQKDEVQRILDAYAPHPGLMDRLSKPGAGNKKVTAPVYGEEDPHTVLMDGDDQFNQEDEEPQAGQKADGANSMFTDEEFRKLLFPVTIFSESSFVRNSIQAVKVTSEWCDLQFLNEDKMLFSWHVTCLQMVCI